MTDKKQDNQPLPIGKPVTDDAILKVAKEVVIKFIEVGRLTPATFDANFQSIYQSIHKTVRSQ